MKKFNKITLGAFAFLMLFSIFGVTNVLAAPATEVSVMDEHIYNYRIEAHNEVMFRFMMQTRLTFMTNVDLEVNIDCDASAIGVKDFILEVNGSGPLLMNMTCTEEQAELGLMNGFTYQIRNRYRYLYQEGFCVQIKCNGTCDAQLKIQSNIRNRNGQWAYYDENSEVWETVPTTLEDGYLVAETDHFSYWTILIPQPDSTVIIVASIGGIIGLIVVASLLISRKRE
ncbi:MAG: hypothetical protein ACFE9Z_01195 [Promethearchaeota archaeon]